MRKHGIDRALFVMFATLLAGCGGGGGGSSAVPAAPFSGGAPAKSSAPSTTGTSTVAISVQVPSVASSAHSRRALYVSASTKSMAITVNGGAPNVTNCTTSCSATVIAPLGTDTFAISLYDAQNGTGNILSSGSASANVVAGRANSVVFTLGGVVAAVTVALGVSSVTVGTAATIPVTVTAKDAQGNAIIGGEPFAAPITLSDSDTSGATALSATSLTAPGATVTLSYNGGSFSGAVIAASVPGMAASAVTAANLSASAAAPVGANVPKHVTTWLYYGLNGINTSIPASYMAAHADYAESDVGESDRGVAFKSAGGKFSVAYTDPSYIPYCQPPFTAPAGPCKSSLGDFNPPENSWYHAADGSRINHNLNSSAGYQEALIPGAAGTIAAWQQYGQQVVTQSPSMDYFLADDSGSTFPAGGNFYGFNAPEVEITTDAAWVAGHQALFAASVRPVIINGVGSDGMPAYNGAYLDASNVGGLNHENCLNADDTGLQADDYNRWITNENSLLANAAHHKIAVCMITGTPSAANRMYVLASWWMSYDPVYSVAAPVTVAADGYAVFPEFDIVPRDPLRSATTDASVLRSPGGAYVREFADCYQAGAPIGRCAAIVNTTHGALALPSLTQSYGKSLGLSGNSSYTGGTATWAATVPAQIPALSGIILAQ